MKAVSADQPDVIAGNALWAYSDADETTNVDTVEDLPAEATRDVSVDIVASRRFKNSLQANAKKVMGGRRHLYAFRNFA